MLEVIFLKEWRSWILYVTSSLGRKLFNYKYAWILWKILTMFAEKNKINYGAAQNYMSSSGMWENPAKWYHICSIVTLTRRELGVFHKFNWHPCWHTTLSLLKITNSSDWVKLNVEAIVILDESNPNNLWNWMNA